MQCTRALTSSIFLFVSAILATGQSVISTHSGLIHYFEGDVYLSDHLLEAHLGKFPSAPPGAELRTESGLAEVLLTPGVFLRLGERSAIRMVVNDLADTQVELLKGSAIVESGEPNPDTSVTLLYKNWSIRSARKGVYRIDCDPARLWVLQGTAQVVAAQNGEPITVEQGADLPLANVLVPERSGYQAADALSAWARGRSESIIADNSITAQIDEDPAARSGLDSFSYFPFLGLSSSSLISPSTYSSSLYQPGFNSIYLPGYTYRPLLLGIIGHQPLYTPSRPLQIRPPTGVSIGSPRPPLRVGAPPTGGPVGIPRPPVHSTVRPSAPSGRIGGAHHR